MVFNNEYSSYPQEIDGYATMPLRRDGIDEIRAADHNRLRDAIVKIETELGTNPKGTWADVATRLDNIGDSHAEIIAHLNDQTDAHDADAISIVDAYENFYQNRTEQVINELAYALPHKPDHVGEDLDWVPNNGIPSFYDGYGTKFLYNISDWVGSDTAYDNSIFRTQCRPYNGIRGIHIFEVSSLTPNGIGTLSYTTSPASLQWKAPGDTSYGTAVDISGLEIGEWVTVYSSTTTSSLRIAKSGAYSDSFASDVFEVYAFEAVDGYFTVLNSGVGWQEQLNPWMRHNYAHYTTNITRAATSSTGVSRNQFMISGIVYPADRGTLVLQRSLEYSVDYNPPTDAYADYFPIAILGLGTVPVEGEPCARFDEDLRISGQKVYAPGLLNLNINAPFDTITLFDRLPIHRDFSEEYHKADGNQTYNNYAIDYPAYQIAKYLIPVSNNLVAGSLMSPSGGQLQSPTSTGPMETKKVSRYRVVHFKPGVSSEKWKGTILNQSDIYSVYDGSRIDLYEMNPPGEYRNEPNSTVAFSRVFVDSNKMRPGITDIAIAPISGNEAVTKTLSGIHYYNSSDDKFNVVVRSNDNLFSNTYVVNDILKFTTNIFSFPSGTDAYGTYGTTVDIWQLMDDGYANFYNDINLPGFNSRGRYIINDSYNAARKPYPAINDFTNKGYLTAQFSDPFGIGDGYTSYGTWQYGAPRKRILINSYPSRSTPMDEYFTDEDYRDGYWNRALGRPEDFTFVTKEGYYTYESGAFDGYRITDWDSTIWLDGYSLQCGGKFDVPDICGLIYPQNNYNGTTNGIDGYILPFQFRDTTKDLPFYAGLYRESYVALRVPEFYPTTLPAYDGYDGNKAYQRLFALVDTDGYTYPTNAGRLRIVSAGPNPVAFSDIAYYNTNRFAKIEVKIPGNNRNSSTNWMDIGKLYCTGKDYLFETGKAYSDDEAHGALDGQPTGTAGDFTVPFTFGRKNNASSGNMIAVRITYYGGAKRTDSRTRIITEIHLLPPSYNN